MFWRGGLCDAVIVELNNLTQLQNRHQNSVARDKHSHGTEDTGLVTYTTYIAGEKGSEMSNRHNAMS